MGGIRSLRTVLAILGLSLITACNASGPRSSSAVLELFTPPSTLDRSPRITLLSLEATDANSKQPHFVRKEKQFEISLPTLTTLQQAHSERPRMQLASATPRSTRANYYIPARIGATRSELPESSFPTLEMERLAPAANDFFITLGTGIVDPEKDPSWTNAAVYPQVPSTRSLPAMRVIGQSARSNDHLQVAPGFLWWASNACCVSLSIPVRVTGTASDWGVLFALTY